MTELKLIRTDSANADFRKLVAELDAFLAIIDGDEYVFYNSLNTIDHIKYAIVAYDKDKPVACGAIREYEPGSMEIKRMYTLPELRGQGIASMVLAELEKWSIESGYKKCILETGWRQPDAISLYKKSGYSIIPNYGKYAGMENSVCFEKKL